jgi:hypothetical protein
MPKCSCGDIAYRPDPIEGRKQAWRCGGCHRTLSRCNCATPAPLDVTDCDCTPGFPHKAQVAATPAPLDVMVAAKRLVDDWDNGEGRYAANIDALRTALAATPAPLDAMCAACGHDDPHVKNGGCGLDLWREGPPPYFDQCMCDGRIGSRIVRFWTATPAPLAQIVYVTNRSLTMTPPGEVAYHLPSHTAYRERTWCGLTLWSADQRDWQVVPVRRDTADCFARICEKCEVWS